MITNAVIRISSVPVALARVAGLSVLERAILTCGRAGVRQVAVVEEGKPDDRVREALASPRLSAAGITVTTAAPDGPAVVMTADRVFDVDIIRRLAASDSGARAVDAAGRDVGIHATGGESPLDIGHAPWAVADSPDTRAAAEKILLRSLRKSVDGPVSRYLNRPMSLSVTRLLVRTPITPNQMTIVATIFGIVGVWSVFQATWLGVAVGAVLVHLQSVLDGCDGEIARLKFLSSKFGEWLDNVLDDLVNASFGLALGYASAVLFHAPIFLWLGVGAASAIMIYNAVVYAQLAIHHGTGNPFAFRWWFQKDGRNVQSTIAGAGLASLTVSFFYALARRDVFLFAFMILAVVRLPQLAVLWYAILCGGYLLMSIIHILSGGMPKVTSR